MRYTWITEQFLPIGEKLGQKGISAARAESISAARFLPGGEKRANTGYNTAIYALFHNNIWRLSNNGHDKQRFIHFCLTCDIHERHVDTKGIVYTDMWTTWKWLCCQDFVKLIHSFL